MSYLSVFGLFSALVVVWGHFGVVCGHPGGVCVHLGVVCDHFEGV